MERSTTSFQSARLRGTKSCIDAQVPPPPGFHRRRLKKIYLIASMFIISSLLQLGALRAIKTDLNYSGPVPSFMWLLIALVSLGLLIFTEIFDKPPINWTLGIVAVECMTLCILCNTWAKLKLLYAGIVVILVLTLNILLYILGALLPLRVLPGYYAILVLTLVFVVVYIIINIFVYAFRNPSLILIVDSWNLLYMLALTLYTATVIHQRRLPYMKSEEYIMSATLITTFFLYSTYLLISMVCALVMRF